MKFWNILDINCVKKFANLLRANLQRAYHANEAIQTIKFTQKYWQYCGRQCSGMLWIASLGCFKTRTDECTTKFNSEHMLYKCKLGRKVTDTTKTICRGTGKSSLKRKYSDWIVQEILLEFQEPGRSEKVR